MTTEHRKQSQTWDRVQSSIDILFVFVFTVECLAGLLAFQRYFFKDFWKLFDVLVVVLCIIKLFSAISFNPGVLRVLRLTKVFRYLRTVRQARGIRVLQLTIRKSFLTECYITILLLTVIYIFSIFGVTTFRPDMLK